MIAMEKKGDDEGWSDGPAPNNDEAAPSPPLAQPDPRESADQQQQPEQAGEHRQHADAAHDAGVAHLHPDPVVAVKRVARAHGASTSGVEVTSANSRGLAGPALTRASSLPPLACQRPSSLAVARALGWVSCDGKLPALVNVARQKSASVWCIKFPLIPLLDVRS
jgi:hypothetical protein